MKKLLAILLALILILSVVGCSSSNKEPANDAGTDKSNDTASDDANKDADGDKSGGKMQVGLCLPDRDQYWTTFETYATKTGEELGLTIQAVVAKEDISTQISQVETFANNGFDAVIVGITNGESYSEILTASGDMKVVFFNRSISDNSVLDGVKCIYVGMSEYDAGAAQGEWLSEYFKDSGKTELNGVMFMGILGLDNVTNRTQGCKDALEKNGYKVNWVFEDTAEWDRAKALDKFTQFMGTGTEFDFVTANNDEMALGVIEACTASNREIDFPIVGIDATEVGCLAIKEGTLKMTVNQNAPLQGAEAMKAAVDLIEGRVPEGCDENFIYSTEAQAITADNADDVLAIFQG